MCGRYSSVAQHRLRMLVAVAAAAAAAALGRPVQPVCAHCAVARVQRPRKRWDGRWDGAARGYMKGRAARAAAQRRAVLWVCARCRLVAACVLTDGSLVTRHRSAASCADGDALWRRRGCLACTHPCAPAMPALQALERVASSAAA